MPRSASRDLSDRYAGHRDDFRRADRVRQWKYALSVVALAATVGWAAFDRFAPARAAFAHTHGVLAGPHAAWDNQCEACHRPGSVSEFGSHSVFVGTGERWRDLTCEKCHAGPLHHAAAEGQTNCAECHNDHQGRTASLTRMADQRCTSCHADLSKHHRDGKTDYQNAITIFAGHPEFRELADNPPNKAYARRGLKFSHALHITPGQLYADKARGAFTLARLSDADRERYRGTGQDDAAAVTLDCASCHRLDSGAGTTAFDALRPQLAEQAVDSILPPRAGGAYFLPVNFDVHCKACHPIKAPATAAPGGGLLESFELPHRRQPTELRKALEGEYATRLLTKKPPLLRPPATDPGRRLDAPPDRPEVKAFRDEVEQRTRETLDFFLNEFAGKPGGAGCAKCHDLANEGDAVRILPILAAVPVPSGERRPRSTRTIWFEHAKFNHAAHRGVSCGECHPGTSAAFHADGTTDVPETEKEPVRIAGVATCRECHAPAASGPRGGVRHGCTDCHQYHNGDHPLQGRGATARDPAVKASIREFLQGSGHR